MRLIRYMSIIMLVVLSVSCESGGKMYAIVISPSEVVVAEGKTQQFEATAFFTDGTTLIWTSAVAWTVAPSDTTTTGTATIGTSFGSYGLVTATTGTGNFIVQASDAANSLSGSALIYVRQPAIAISPANAYLPLNTSHQFTAMGTMVKSAGTLTTTVDLTSSVTWTTVSTDFASVGTGGLITANTSTPGITDLSASYIVSGTTITVASTTVTITAGPLDLLILDPAAAMISRSTASTISFTAQGRFQDGITFTAPGLTAPWTWSSSTPSVAIIDPVTAIATVGQTDGTTTITATDPISGAEGTTTLTIGP